jgi:preprotein translocase subunit SecD
MMYFSRLKTALILGACVLGVLLSIPNAFPAPAAWLPWRTIHLGLDLRGGSYLLMEVDMSVVIKERLEALADQARRSMDRAGIRPYTLTPLPADNRLLVKPADPARIEAAAAALRELVTTSSQGVGARPDLDLATTAEGVTLTLSQVALTERANQAVQQSIEIVRRRIDETGVLDPLITRQGTDRIVVQLPGVEDPERIKQLLGKTARMTFRLTDENANLSATVPPPGEEFLPYQDKPGQKIAVRKRVEVDGANLTDARAGQNGQTGEWVVNFTFDSLGTRRFADISRANVGHPFAIVLDDKVISAPVIREPITGGRPRGAAARRRPAGAADGGGGAQRRPGTGGGRDPRGRHLAGRRLRVRHPVHGDFLRVLRLDRQRGAGGQPDPDDGGAEPAERHADAAGHGRHPADAGHGGGRQHPDQRAHPRGSA